MCLSLHLKGTDARHLGLMRRDTTAIKAMFANVWSKNASGQGAMRKGLTARGGDAMRTLQAQERHLGHIPRSGTIQPAGCR